MSLRAKPNEKGGETNARVSPPFHPPRAGRAFAEGSAAVAVVAKVARVAAAVNAVAVQIALVASQVSAIRRDLGLRLALSAILAYVLTVARRA